MSWVIPLVVLGLVGYLVVRAIGDAMPESGSARSSVDGFFDEPDEAGTESSMRVVDAVWTEDGSVAAVLEGDRMRQVAVLRAVDGGHVRGPVGSPVAAGAATDDRPILASGHGILALRSEGGVTLVELDGAQPRWAVAVPGHIADAVLASSTLVVRTDDGQLRGLSAADGSLRWTWNGGLASTAVRVGDSVVVDRFVEGAGTEQVLLDPATGSTLRVTRAPCRDISPFSWTIHVREIGGTEVIGVGVNSPDLVGCAFRMDLATGSVAWVTTFTGVDLKAAREAVAGPEHLAMARDDGGILVIDRADGGSRSLGPADGRRRLPLGLQGGALIVGAGESLGNEDRAEVWDAATGTRRWSRPLPGPTRIADGDLHANRPRAGAGGVSWSDTQVFLCGPIGVDGEPTTVERVDLGTGVVEGAPLRLGPGRVPGRLDFTHPHDGQILGIRNGLTIVSPAGAKPIQWFSN